MTPDTRDAGPPPDLDEGLPLLPGALGVPFDGTAQDERFPRPLDPQWFRVDEFGLPQRVALLVHHARSLGFTGTSGELRGHWGELLMQDEAVVLALIACRDVQRMKAAFERLHEAAAGGDADALAAAAAPAMELVGDFDDWLQHLRPVPERGARAVTGYLERHLPALWPDVQWLREQFASRREAGRLQALHASWRTVPAATASRRPQRPPREQLRICYFAMLALLARLQEVARSELPISFDSGHHEPATGLLLAFLRLYETVQERINRFADRRIEHYYREVLQLSPRPAGSADLHLLLSREAQAAAPTVLPPGTRFGAGVDAGGNSIEFAVEHAVTITDAQVATLRTLRQERDPLAAPERQFGYVARVSCAEPPAATAPGEPPWALFGGTLRGRSERDAREARIGFALASPVLRLHEGTRELTLVLQIDTSPLGEVDDLLARLEAADSEAAFSAVLGPLFTAWLLDPRDRLGAAGLQRVRRAAARWPLGERSPGARPLSPADPLCLLGGEVSPERDLMLEHLLMDLFDVELSVAAGWAPVPAVAITRQGGPDDPAALALVMPLSPSFPAVVPCVPAVHGAAWPAGEPVLSLRLSRRSRLCAVSLLGGLRLVQATLSVHVQGLRTLSIHNQLGRLDPGKPFAPFGPLPTTASYLVVGAPELAGKAVDLWCLHVDWSGLPDAPGGFAVHYRDYGDGWNDAAFRLSVALLRDGWLEVTPAARGLPLFVTDPETRAPQRRTPLAVDGAALRAYWRPADGPLDLEQGARSGFVRLQLGAPAAAFGHAMYPTLLTQTLSANVRRRRRPRPMPMPPYTPLVERCSLEYRATARLRPGRGTAELAEARDRLLHLHPFGLREVYPAGGDALPTLLPDLGPDGQLLIGLVAAAPPQGPLTLLFDLHDESADEALARERLARGAAVEPHWAVMMDDAWVDLRPEQLLSDTTLGLLGPGIVTLDLPEGLTRDNPSLPGPCYWLRLSTPAVSDAFAGLRGVRAQAVRVLQVAGAAAPLDGRPLAPATAVPGLAGVLPAGSPSTPRPAEDRGVFRTRAAERLRHKGRACLPWDFERLVLERFPGVHKVKCFDNLVSPGGERRAGHVLVVVVPDGPRNDPARAAQPARLNADELRRIEEHLRPLCSPLVSLQVRNASYEWVQVRCTVRLRSGVASGRALERINRAITEYLSPWHDGGHESRFGWRLQGEHVEACVRALDEVQSVGGLSLLHAGEDEAARGQGGRYWLVDTAPEPGEPAPPPVLRWRQPWSLLLPLDTHLIDLDPAAAAADADAADDEDDELPQRSGVASLAIGRTFIVGDEARP